MLMLLLAVIYIAAFSCRLCAKFAPVLRAMADESAVIPRVRVSLAFLAGIVVYVTAWAYVFSVILEGLYV